MRSFKRNIYRLSTETAYSCDLSNGTAVEVTAPIVCISYNVEIPEVDTVTISYYDCNNNFVPLEALTGPDNIQFCAKEGTVLTVPNGTSVVTAVGSCGSPIPFDYDYSSTSSSSTAGMACAIGAGAIDNSLYGPDSTIPINSYVYTDPDYNYPKVGNQQWYKVLSNVEGAIAIQIGDTGKVLNKVPC